MKQIEVSEKEMEKLIEKGVERPFSFSVPIDNDLITKSIGTDDPNDPTSWKVGGIASTDDKDIQKEIVVPAGIDTSYFLRFGILTWDHKPGPEAKVGTPTDAYVNKEGFYVKGFLWKEVPAAQHIYSLMKIFAEHPEYGRKVNWSIEGKSIVVEGNRIVKSWLKDCTLTLNGVNTNTWATIVKSMAECDYYTIGGKVACSCKGEDKVAKALEAGYAVTDQTGGEALRAQDLEKKLHVLTNPNELSEAELKEYAMSKGGFGAETADKLINYAKALKNVKAQSAL